MTNEGGVVTAKKPLLPRWLKFVLMLLGFLFLVSALLWVIADISTRDALEAELAKLRALGWPTELEELYPDPIPDAENAALLYDQAFAKLRWRGKHVSLLGAVRVRDGADRWSDSLDERKQRVITVLDQHAEELELVQQAARKKSCRFDLTSKPLYLRARHGFELDTCAALLNGKAFVAAVEGDIPGAFRNWLTWARVARHDSAQKVAPWQKNRIWRVYDLVAALEALVQTGQLMEKDLVGALEALEGLEAREEFIEAVKSDAIAISQLLDAPAEELCGIASASGPGPEVAAELVAWLYASPLGRPWRQHDHATFLRLLSENVQLGEQPFHKVRQEVAQWQRKRDELSWTTPVSAYLAPFGVGDALELAYLAAQLGAARAGVALELYRLENGDYPARLDELCPDYLPAVPIDPFTGQVMRYVRSDDRVAVYSIGEDLLDDGGAERLEEILPLEPWPHDIVFTLRRAPTPTEK